MSIEMFPLWLQYSYVAILGLVIGSFLNVCIYRLNTGKSLNGNSHCLSCGARLRWFELVPVVSYVVLRGSCRVCSAAIPVRYLLVEVLTAVLFIASFTIATDIFELAFLLVTMSLLVVIAVYDIRHYIIPDSLTILLTIVASFWYCMMVLSGETYLVVVEAIIAAGLGSGFFYLLWFISKGAWLGFGDVKLAFPLGLIVGPAYVFSMIVYSFWIGAVVSVFLVGLAAVVRGQVRLRMALPQLTIKSVVPFAPFMIAGCLLVLFTRYNVLSLFSSF